MTYFSKSKKIGFWHPSFVASDILDIDYNYLAANGIKVVAFDVDGTLTVNGSNSIDTIRANKLIKMLDTAGIKKRYLASNSIRDLDQIISKLPNFEAHQPHEHSGKPSKEFYQKLINKSGIQPQEIVMVGDRAIQDIWGPQRLGITTILVELKPKFCTLKDKIMLRNIWQKYLVRLKRS